MTLIANEFHCDDYDLRKAYIISLADRLITVGEREEYLPKIVKVDNLRATVSYYGLADVMHSTRSMYDYLREFALADRSKSLDDFALNLKSAMERANNDLKKFASGFHIAGFNERDLPQLWFVRNIVHHDKAGGYYKYEDQYQVTEDFLARDVQHFGYDAANSEVSRLGTWRYTNGQIVSTNLALTVGSVAAVAEIVAGRRPMPKGPNDIAGILRTAAEAECERQEHLGKERSIGGSIDCYLITAEGVTNA